MTWELVAAIRAAGTTVVLVTHLMDEAERLCDRVAIIDEGRIVAQGTPAELMRPLATGAQVRFSATNGFDAAWLEGVAGVTSVVREDEQIVVHGRGPLLARVATALAEREVPMADLRTEHCRTRSGTWPRSCPSPTWSASWTTPGRVRAGTFPPCWS